MQRGAPAVRQAGVTLVELLTVVTIAGILMAIGVPSYRYITTDNRTSTEANKLLGDLQFARSEAVREGQSITVCVALSTNPTSPSCAASGTTTWEKGWIVFGDVNNDQTIDTGDPVLRIQNAFGGSDTFGSNHSVSAVTFNRSGFVNQLGATQVTVTLHDSTSYVTYTRCLNLTQAGMLSVQTHAQNPSGCS
ncbi:MAG TPA: GspH/FimT family pseudopilin [Steroidobacteraceae bacterium]